MNRCLTESVSNIDVEAIKNSKDINKITYRIIRCPEFSVSNTTNMVLHPKFLNPYSLMIDEYLLLFAFTNNYNVYLNKGFFNMKKEVFSAPINKIDNNQQILPIDEEKYFQVNIDLINHMKQKRMDHLNLFWDRLHVAIGGIGKSMPNDIKKEIFK